MYIRYERRSGILDIGESLDFPNGKFYLIDIYKGLSTYLFVSDVNRSFMRKVIALPNMMFYVLNGKLYTLMYRIVRFITPVEEDIDMPTVNNLYIREFITLDGKIPAGTDPEMINKDNNNITTAIYRIDDFGGDIFDVTEVRRTNRLNDQVCYSISQKSLMADQLFMNQVGFQVCPANSHYMVETTKEDFSDFAKDVAYHLSIE